MRSFILLFFPVLLAGIACSPVQPSFEWDSQLEQLKSEVLKKACNSEHRASFEKLIASQSLDLNYEEMMRSLKNMLFHIRCE